MEYCCKKSNNRLAVVASQTREVAQNSEKI